MVDGRPVAPLEIAATVRARGKGLLGRQSLAGGLWLKPCRHVHTMRMKFAIDVAHVDTSGSVIAVETLKSNRFAHFHWRTRSVLEAEAGAFVAWGLEPGAVLAVAHQI